MKTKEATLISEIKPHTPPPLAGNDKNRVDEFYQRFNVLEKGVSDKIQALQKVIQTRHFFACGGSETLEMELRANERIYLMQHAL